MQTIRRLFVRAFVALGLVLALAPATARAADPLRIFIRGGVKTHGPNQHDHPRFLGEWTKLLGERGLKVDGAMQFPSGPQLDAIDVLIIYAADGMKITGDDRAVFEKFIRRGGGVMVLHDGVVSGDQQEWCKQVIGGTWRWPDATLPKEKATKWLEGDVGIYFTDLDHPISRGLSNFDWKDEIYYDLDMAPDAGVLATSFHNVHIIAPQLWTYERTWSGGTAPYRAFVSLPGHEFDVFSTAQYRSILLRGIAWAGKRANVDEFCKPEELASLKYPPGGPKPASEAIKTFQLHPDFNLSLAADENVAEKIMSVDWDSRGRMWVVETPEYPNGRDINKNDAKITPWRIRDPEKYPLGSKESRPARDRISVLEDTNGDGIMDKKTVFYTGLELPTSLVFYKDGVIVSQAPDTLWIRDTDGDGKADKVEVLFTGWGTFDAHAVTSNLRWGPDGWIYGSVGYSSGEPHSPDGSRKFGRISAGLYRFRPDGSALEQYAAGSCNTWGCEVAPDGEIFFSTATCGEPILHVVMPEKIISRAGVPGMRAAKSIIEENKIFTPRHETRQPYLQIDWVGAFTAASGSTIYDGGAWPGKWQGPSWSFFLHEPTVWLTHHEFLDPTGVTYQGRREEGRKDTHFFTSTDYWFKPIHSQVGPDGALYVVDFYNQIAVHNDTRGPAHGARNAASRPDRNHEFTRVWRIQHKQAQVLPPFKLDARDAAGLVNMLDHPNGWVRTTANRLLSEGAGRTVIAAIETKANAAKTSYGRMQALWVLHNLGSDDNDLLLAAAGDDDLVVRKNAIRIAAESDHAGVEIPARLIRARLADPNPRARLLVFTALTTFTPSRDMADAVVEAWPTLKDKYLETAALAVSAGDPLLFLDAALDARDPAFLAGMVPHLARQVAQRQDAVLAAKAVALLASKPAATDALKALVLESLAANLKANVAPLADDALRAALKSLVASQATAGAALPLVARWNLTEALGDSLKGAVAKAVSKLSDKSLSDDARAQIAVNLLGVRRLDASIVTAVATLVGSDASAGLQRRIIDALGTTADPAAGAAMLAAMPSLDFDLREAAFGQLLKRADWSASVVQALADRKLDPRLLGTSNLYRLRTHSDKAVAERAGTTIDELKGPEEKQKDQLIAKFQPEVAKPGDVANGAKLFTQNCAVCHKFKNEGAEFAPNLTGMGAHGAEELIVHILDPNRIVEPNFVSVSIETKDDLSYDGIVLRENNSAVVVRNQTAETEIRKDNIKTRRSTGRSLMPEGFEQLGAVGLRDLLTFLCVDEQRFRILDLRTAFTANTTRGIYMTADSRDESLRFRKWGTIKHRDVPFDIVSTTRTPTGNNAVVLQGGDGMSRNYPKEVSFKVGMAVSRLHFLGGVAGWGYPLGEKDKPAAKITVHYAGGKTDEFVLRNGVEIADYISKIDVPGSEALENLDQLLLQGRQLRYFSRTLPKKAVVEKITLSSYANEVAPTFVSVTAEIGDLPPGTAASASSAAAATTPRPAITVKWASGLRVLLIGGGASHDYQRWFNLADVALLNGTGKMSAAYLEPQDVSVDSVRSADVLLISANKAFPDAAVRKAIFDHVEAGKGLVILHPGLWYNWPDWPEFNKTLAGGGSRGHDRLGEFEVVVNGGDHPLTRGVAGTFKITDELYWFEPDTTGTPVKVLATAQSAAKKTAFAQVFVVEHPKARIAGITLGHDGLAHSLDAYQTLLKNAVTWVAGK